MKRGILIVVLIALLLVSLTLAYSFFSHGWIFKQITGRQVFSDIGFERPATDFGAGKSGVPKTPVALSPASEDVAEGEPETINPGCIVDEIILEKESVSVGEDVLATAFGKDCTGIVNVDVYEDDFIFDDFVKTIGINFVNGVASFEIDFDDKIAGLFGEAFEGDELEFYLKVDFNGASLRSDLLSIIGEEGEIVLLQALPSGGYIPLGKGCTNAWYIDEDCDGYGTAAQTTECRGDCGPTRQGVPGDKPDAYDLDPTINTPQSVYSDSRYGNPSTNMAGFKNFLSNKFGFNVNNVYFISLTGNDNTGAPNNVNLPYRSFGGVRSRNSLGNSDVVILRGGVYYNPPPVICANTVSGSAALSIDNLDIPAGNPLVVTTYPGELVRLDGNYALNIRDSTNIIADGFLIYCGNQCRQDYCNFWGGYKGIDLDNNHNLIIQNTEVTGFKWGVHGGFNWGKTLFRKVVAHDNSAEHNIYSPSNCYPAGVPHVQTDITIEDSLLYRGRRTGYQQNGPGENINLIGNIIHSNAGAGITFTSGVQNSKIINNLIFNNNHYGIVIWHDNANPEPCTRNNENNEVTNNIIFQGTEWNRVCNSGGDRDANGWIACQQPDNPSTFPAFSFADNRPRPNADFIGHIFRNNIFVTQGAPVFSTSDLNDIALSVIENNIFYRADGNSLNGLVSRRWAVDGDTDGSHSAVIGNPARYYWTLSAMQTHPTWRDNIRNNIAASLIGSLFIDISNYVFTPGLYNFIYSTGSPAINFGTGTPGVGGIPFTDIRGLDRISPPDAGAYEYNSLSSSNPYLLGVSPSYVSVGASGGWGLTFTGYNFDLGAALEVCDFNNVCDPILNSALYGMTSNRILHDFVTSGISPGPYTFRVVNPGGAYSPNRVTVNVQGVPATPTVLTASSILYNRVSLSWADNSNDENGFYIERSLSQTSGFTQIGINNANDNTFTDNAVSASTTYYYRVRAFNNLFNSGYSNALQVNVPSIPTCASQGGTICAISYYCPGNSLVHSGAGICCNIACQQETSAPVGHWKFDDTISPTDPAIDSSGNNFAGTCTTGACPNYLSGGGQLNEAYDFDGIDDRIVVADNNLLDLTAQGTIMAWVRPDTLGRWHGVITKGDAPTHAYGIEINPSNRFACQLNGVDYNADSVTLSANNYYHIACTWNSGVLNIYVNGALVRTLSGVTTPSVNSGGLQIGAWPATGAQSGWDWMDGRIDDVRIYNRALSLAGIQAAMASSSGTFDFSLSLNPTSGSVSQGNSVWTTVTATYISGTSGAVTFSASNLPSGVTATFNPTSCTPVSGTPCTSTLTLTASGSAASATNQQVSVIGTSGTTIRNTLYSLSVNTIPSPNSPTGLIVTAINSTAIRLNWTDNSSNELGFILQYKLSSGTTFANVASALVANTITFVHNGLTNNTSYDYRILAYNSGGNSSFSSVASGTTLQNPPLNFALARNPASGTVQQGSDVLTIVTATYVSGTTSSVSFSASNLSTGVNASFSPASCTPAAGIPCSSTLMLAASGSAALVTNRQVVITGTGWNAVRNVNYALNVTAPLVCINGQTQPCTLSQGVCLNSSETCVNNNWPGCNYAAISGYALIETGVALCRDGLDNDCDGTRDLGGDSGCPIPSTSGFSLSLTTNLSNLTDFTRVANLSVGISGLGRIQYAGQEVSLWRLVSGVYAAINLNDAVDIFNNLIGVNSENYFELNQTATLTFYNLTYSERPAVMVQTATGPEACSSTRCSVQSYNNSTGELVVLVAGFSNYSTQAFACGDNYCSSSETCSSCAGDCGACSSPSPGPSGGGGGGGGSGGRRIVTQCSDGIDNDGDGLIDYPYDSGCLNREDNIELDAGLLVTPAGNEDLNNSASDDVDEERAQTGEKDIEIRFVFWSVLGVLAGGIAVVIIIIIRSLRRHRRFEELIASASGHGAGHGRDFNHIYKTH